MVRTTHWGLVALISIDLVNEAGANPWHRYLGYLAVALVVVRLAWGCVDRGHAGLASMASQAWSALSHLKGRRAAQSVGHTPRGALMAFMLWGLLLLVGVTGWMLGLDAFWGDEQMQQVHAWLAYALAACVCVHLVAAIAISHAQRVNLIKAMITGNKPA